MNEMNDIRFIDTSQVPRTYIQSLEQCVYRLQDSSSKVLHYNYIKFGLKKKFINLKFIASEYSI